MVEFRASELIVRTLYRQTNGPNPGTKGRAKEVAALAREGLREALGALEGCVDVIGTSGYEIREDTISVDVALKKGA
jgi:hypothetical protein